MNIPERSIIDQANRNQNLTFRILKGHYSEKEFNLHDDTFAENLDLLTPDGKYNVMAGLLADRNNISIKIATFNGTDKAELVERNEYGDISLLSAINKVFTRFDALNITKSTLTGQARRIDKKLFDVKCAREALLNAVGHARWIDNIPPAVYVFYDRIEIVSFGGLPKGLTKEDFFRGKSQPRCPELMKILSALEYVEQTGHGVRKIVDVYGEEVFEITDNFVTVTIPFDKEVLQLVTPRKIIVDERVENLNDREKQILRYIEDNGKSSRKEIESLLNIKKDAAIRILKKLIARGILETNGETRKLFYVLKKDNV